MNTPSGSVRCDEARFYGEYLIVNFKGQDRIYKHDPDGQLMEYHSPLFRTLKAEMELLAGMYSAAIKQNVAITKQLLDLSNGKKRKIKS